MSRFQIKPAVRKGQKARVALSSPSGGGKTWTALEIATVLADDRRVLVIDTERGEASLYADDFDFDTIEWTPPFSPWELAQVIREIPVETYSVVVVDSLSHFWKGPGGTLSIVDENAPKGNSYVGWKVGGEAQDEMVSALTSAECHVIATMRSKTEYVLETNERGKQQPRKVGLAPVQRDDLEYEFTLTGELDKEHTLRVDKSRCSALADRVFPAGNAEEMAQVLKDWLESAQPLATVRQRRELQARLDNLDREDRLTLRPEWKDRGYDLDRLLASEVDGASELIAKHEPAPRQATVQQNGQKVHEEHTAHAEEPAADSPGEAVAGRRLGLAERFAALPARLRNKVEKQRQHAGLPALSEALSTDEAEQWDAVLSSVEVEMGARQ